MVWKFFTGVKKEKDILKPQIQNIFLTYVQHIIHKSYINIVNAIKALRYIWPFLFFSYSMETSIYFHKIQF